ncbi:fungal-specific transcription factor domain-domain-containing protein [Leucosporidium creatinivorum]|uniref:Fungal-specific transcription factor domain-domain-containing protein n=1 Tax=Leucosporidium creatinivorum TaxID=106004 RepID=A0A1Y2F295_9BASI|nr:fungal-specific transcription factor domain-domain-containing protein [Leucosporidium creatinivorum]
MAHAGTSAAQPESLKKKRKLCTAACDSCRSHKKRCSKDDPAGPCSECSLAGIDCRFSVVQRKRGPKKGHLEALESSLTALRRTLAALPSNDPTVEAAMVEHLGSEDFRKVKELSASTLSPPPPRSAPSVSPPSFLTPLPVQAAPTPDFAALFGTLGPPSVPVFNPQPPSPSSIEGQLFLHEGRVALHGSSSGLDILSPYGELYVSLPSTPAASSTPLSAQAQARKLEVARRLWEDDLLPDVEGARILLDLFWSMVHPVVPVVYREAFDAQVEGWVDACGASRESEEGMKAFVEHAPYTLLLVCMYVAAESYNSAEQGRGGKETRIARLAAHANMILETLADDSKSRLVRCQSVIMLAYAALGRGEVRVAWMHIGLAMRLAQDLHLFRDTSAWPEHARQAFSHEETEVGKRCWHACVYLDNIISSIRGQPTAIRDVDWDTALPSTDEPDELNQWRPCLPLPASSPRAVLVATTKSFALSCFNASARLAALGNRILSELYSVRKPSSGAIDRELARSHLDIELRLFYSTLSPSLAVTGPAIPPPHLLSLHCQYYMTQILLNRSFLSSPSATSSISLQATQACRVHATSLLNLVRLQDVFYGLGSATAPMHFFLFAAATVSAHTISHPTDASSSSHASNELQAALFALGQVEATWEGAKCASTLLQDFLRKMGLVEEVQVDEEEDELEEEGDVEREGDEEGGVVSPRVNEFWLA